MATPDSGVNEERRTRLRLTIASISMGAIAIVAFAIPKPGSRIGGAMTASPSSRVADRVIPPSAAEQNPAELRNQAANRIAGLPLYFEANRGQVDPSVRYLARSGRYSLFLTDDAAVFSLIGGETKPRPLPGRLVAGHEGETRLTESAVRVRLVGANPHPVVQGLQPLPGRVNYLIGAQKNWHRDIPTFGRVRFHNIYPGVDVVYYGTPAALEYDLIAAPGADTSKIEFAIEGPATTTQTPSGDIVIATGSGTIRIAKPRNYQQNGDGSRTPVAGSFKLAKDGTIVAGIPTRQVGFRLAGYDRARTLFIDPVVTPTPGSIAKRIPDSIDLAAKGSSVGPARLEQSCVTKIIPYSTYFGGNGSSVGPLNLEQLSQFLGNASLMGSETGVDVALDPSANVYITGAAYSNNLPAVGFYQPSLQGGNSPPSQNPNVFVAEFNPNRLGAGSLVYATYLGANGNTDAKGTGDGDLGLGIAVDGSGDAYVVGQTYSGQVSDSPSEAFPGTASCGVWGQKNIGTNANTNQGFVSELAAGGDSLVYSCYIPGANDATAARVALVPGCASDCDAYVVGSTQSTSGAVADGFDGFVVSSNAAQSQLATDEGGLSNAFLLVVAGGGNASAPLYSTYYGGTGNGLRGDTGLGLSVESATQVAITGSAFSSDIPLTANAAQSTFLGTANRTSMAFVAMFNPQGTSSTSLTYGSYLGGSGNKNSKAGVATGDVGTAIVLDGSDLWVGGLTASTDFPVDGIAGVNTTNPPYQSANGPETNAGTPATTGFVTEVVPGATAGLGQVVYSTYFGGTGFSKNGVGLGDAIGAMAEHDGIVYVTGLTTSAKKGTAGTFPISIDGCQTTNNSSGLTIDGVSAPVTAFVSALDTTQPVASTQLEFSMLLGGSGQADVGLGLQYDPVGEELYVVGSTYSTDFPITSTGYQTSNHDFNLPDSFQSTAAFLTQVTPLGNTCPPPVVTPSPTPTATATGATPTATATATASATRTGTATATATGTATATATATPTPTATATPIEARLTFSPKSLKFGARTAVGKVSKSESVTIKNDSSKKSKIDVTIIGESAAAPFAVQTECITSLAPGKSCKVSVTFSPTDSTEQNGKLTINDNVAGAPQQIPLSGTGKQPKKK